MVRARTSERVNRIRLGFNRHEASGTGLRYRYPFEFRGDETFIVRVAIPAMSISDSDLMAISSERSDAGVFILDEVIGFGQASGSFPPRIGQSSSSRFSFVLGC